MMTRGIAGLLLVASFILGSTIMNNSSHWSSRAGAQRILKSGLGREVLADSEAVRSACHFRIRDIENILMGRYATYD